jgi:hypothetical protein
MAGTIVCALQTTTGPPASALDRWVELPNTHVRSDRRNIDLLGEDYLAPASSASVKIDDGAGCRFDVKTVFDDGTTQIRRDVDMCAVERYAISYR